MSLLPPLHGESNTSLSLRLHRVNGKRVQASAVGLRSPGLHIGSDAVALPLSAALHVAPRHASVSRDAGEWFLSPACEQMILAVNGQKILWGERHPLRAGDCIEIGFTSIVVELNGDEASGLSESSGLPEPSELPEFASFSKHLASIDCIQDAQHTEPSDYVALTLEAPKTAHQTNEETPSDAELLRQLLNADAEDCPNTYALQYATRDPLQELLHIEEEKSETPASSAMPQDILSVLAEESERVLKYPPDMLASPMSNSFSVPQPTMPLEEMPFLSSEAGSLEEILHGPLSIDDVLESLRQQSSGKAQINLSGDVFEQADRMPDPLRLLAGMEDPLPREPELAPVLHRAHRAVGMNTPYPSSGAHSLPGTHPNKTRPPLRVFQRSEQGENS